MTLILKACLVLLLAAFAVAWMPPLLTGAETGMRFLRLSDGEVITLDGLVKDLWGVDLVFVGEMHDNKEHHEAQLRIIQALNSKGRPTAAGLEMFRHDSQQELDQWVEGNLSMSAFLPIYYDNWTMPWSLYEQIFLYARDYRIPLVGLNVSQRITRKVAEEGFSSLTEAELRSLPPISCDVDREYMNFIRRFFRKHGGEDGKFVYFCEAQVLWDKAMAWYLVKFYERKPGYTTVVLAGINHSFKSGIPSQVRKLSELSYKVVSPKSAGIQDTDRVTEEDVDYVILD